MGLPLQSRAKTASGQGCIQDRLRPVPAQG
jgi:hypothetical protein